VWGATNIQVPGKYIADHVWSSTAMDNQLGCAAMLAALMRLDPSIKPKRETAIGADEEAIVVPPAPSRTKSVGIGASIVVLVATVATWADAHPWLIVGAVAVAVVSVIVAIRHMEK
jgi:hypothetical protein